MQEKKARIIYRTSRIVAVSRNVIGQKHSVILPAAASYFQSVVDKVGGRVIAWRLNAQDCEPLSMPAEVSEWNEWQRL